jgi:2-polyprenyl-3-methyl-5-hydroxy-6-metoxy-1,4-benzoquinol methylase
MSLATRKFKLYRWLCDRIEKCSFHPRTSPPKDLQRPSGVSCPACLSAQTGFVADLPYHRTHLDHWHSTLEDYLAIVDDDKLFARFEIRACTQCELIFVPESYSGLVERIETHPRFLERTAKPYLDHIQNNIVDDAFYNRLIDGRSPNTPPEESVLNIARLVSTHLSPGARFLDLGCCKGGFAELVRKMNPTVEAWGCDTNPEFIRHCRERYPNIRTCEGKLGSDTNTVFDFVNCVDVIEHIWDLDEFVRSARAQLSETGRMLIRTPDTECFESRKRGYHWWAYLAPHHCQLFCRKVLNALMRRLGFEELETGSGGQEFWGVYRPA